MCSFDPPDRKQLSASRDRARIEKNGTLTNQVNAASDPKVKKLY